MASKLKITAILGLLIGAFIWGVIWYPYRLLLGMGISGELATFASYMFALLFALPLYWRHFKALKRGAWIVLSIGVLGGYTNLAYVLGTIYGEVMRVLLLFYLAPLWTVVFARLLLKEKLNLAGYAVIIFSLAGAVLMLWNIDTGSPVPRTGAEWLGLSAGFAFALSNVLIRKADTFSIELKSLSVCMGVAGLALLPLIWHHDTGAALIHAPVSAWIMLALLGVIILCANLAVQHGLTHVPANQAIVILLFELVVAAVAAYFLATETMSLREWIGGAMIIAASLFSGRLSDACK